MSDARRELSNAEKARLAERHAMASALLARLADRLPASSREQLATYDSVGEVGLLVNLLTAVLVRRSIPVSPTERDALRALLGSFGPDLPVHYRYINDRDASLAALTIA